MDAAELSQFLRILAVAFGALFAAPIVVFLAEAADRRSERERERAERPWATPRFV